MEFIDRSPTPKAKNRRLEVEVAVLFAVLLAAVYFVFFNKTPAGNNSSLSGMESSANKAKAALQSLTAPSANSVLSPEEERAILEKLTAPGKPKKI